MMESSSRPRALYVSAFLPDEFAPHAGGQAAFQNRLDLERAGYEVVSLICTTEFHENSTAWPNTSVFRQTLGKAFVGYLINLLLGRTVAFAAWAVLDTRANRSFECALRDELSQGCYDLIVADFTQIMLPVARALHPLATRPLSRCCAHDLFVQKMLRGESSIGRLLTGPVVRAERNLLRSFDEVVTLSDKDKALAKQLYDLKNVSVRPWTAPRWVGAVSRRPAVIKRAEILFFANFGRSENAEAANWFLMWVWPSIRRAVPEATLVLGGAGSDSILLPEDVAGVRRTGFIKNPVDLFESCELAIAPLAFGAGVKFKVLEALACGVTVVGTSVALEGIQHNALTVESSREKFAETLIEILKNCSHSQPIANQ